MHGKLETNAISGVMLVVQDEYWQHMGVKRSDEHPSLSNKH